MKRAHIWRGLLVLLVALVVLPPLWVELRPTRAGPAAVPPVPPGRYRVWVADWGTHTSITLEQPPGWATGPVGEAQAPFVEWAWGDRRFYMESNYRPDAVLATLLLPTESVTYLDGLAAPPGAGARSVYVREVNDVELRALAAALEASIRRVKRVPGDERPAPHPPAAGYAGRFYPGVGPYTWWTNCNRWTLDRLHAAGLARGGRGVIFSGQVARRLVGFRPAHQ